MFEKMGLGAVLTFNSTQAVAGMTRAGSAMTGLSGKAQRLQLAIGRMGMGAARIGTGLSSLAMAAAPIGIALGFGIREAMNYESAMSEVGAVTRASADELAAMQKVTVSATEGTIYSATEGAQALIELGRAGLSASQSMAALPGVIAMATAEGMDLQSAAAMTTQTIYGMGLSASDAGHMADVLADASARTMTSISQLGEAFSYAAPAARDAGLSLEQTAAAMGMLSNAGLQGSQAGTMLEAMLRGLKGVTDRSRDALDKLGVEVRNADGSMRPIADVIDDMTVALSRYSKEEQDALLFQVFRTEGSRAFNAIRNQGAPALRELTAALENSSTMTDEWGNTVGAATLMAYKRMDNAKGAVLKLKATLKTFAATTLYEVLGPIANALNRTILFLSNFIETYRTLATDRSPETIARLNDEMGTTIVQAAMGIREGFATIGKAWATVKGIFSDIATTFGSVFGEVNVQQIVKWVTVIGLATTALGPLGLALKAVLTVGGGLANIIAGAGGIVSGLVTALPIIAGVGAALGAVFLVVRNDGESVGETLTRVVSEVQAFAIQAYNWITAVFGPVVDALVSVFTNNVIPVLSQLRDVLRTIFGDIFAGIEAITVGMMPQWQAVGASLAEMFRGIGSAFQASMSGFLTLISAVWGFLSSMLAQMKPGFETLLGILSQVFSFLGTVFTWIGQVAGFVYNAVAWLVNEFSWLGNVIATVFNAVMEILDPILGVLMSIAEVLMSGIWSILQAIWAILQPIFAIISSIGQWLWEKLKPAFELIKDVVVGIWNVLGWILDNVIRPLTDLVGGALVGAFQAVGSVVSGIADGVRLIADVVGGMLGGISAATSEIKTIMAAQAEKKRLEERLRTYKHDVSFGATQQIMTLPTRAGRAAEAAAAAAEIQVNNTPPNPEDAPTPRVNVAVENNTAANIDGRCVSRSVSRTQAEARDRAGMTDTPYQRRAAVVAYQSVEEAPCP